MKFIEFQINDGNFEEGFSVKLKISEENESHGQLPAAADIPELYRDWQREYSSWRTLQRRRILKKEAHQVTHISSQPSSEQARKAVEALKKRMKNWFQEQYFSELTNFVLRKITRQEPAHIIFEINDKLLQQQNNELLQKLPWNVWHVFEQREEVWFSLSLLRNQHSVAMRSMPPVLRTPVKILAVLGDDEGINTQIDKNLLEDLGAQIELLEKPTRRKFHDKLWEECWDVLFFAGHSSSHNDGNSGEIQINSNDSLNLDDFKNALKKAIRNGLTLALFNSCDGLGLANQLAELEIPQVIVMRELVPDEVAQDFLKEFLDLFSKGKRFDLAVRQALEKLEVLENIYPGASWLPVICQNPTAGLPVWSESNWLESKGKKIKNRIYQFWKLHKEKIVWGSVLLLAGSFIGLSAGILIFQQITKAPPVPEKTTKPTPPLPNPTSESSLANLFSFGERVLISANSSEETRKAAESEKRKGTEEFAKKNFESATKHFQNSREKHKNDPENLIYLNNAIIGESPSYTIAVPIPIDTNKTGAEEILRGVAQAQHEINEAGGIKGKLVRVLIANDGGDPNLASQVAKELLTNSNVLGVVGHYASTVALKVAEVYDNKLVVIFPISTAVELSNLQYFGNYVFRTVPSDACSAKVLANSMVNRLKQKKAAVLYNSQSDYSNSLRSEFKKAIVNEGGEVTIEFDLQSLDEPQEIMSQIEKKGANVLVLFPDTNTLEKALKVSKANDKGLDVLGGDDVYNPKTLEYGNAKIFVAVPWNIQLHRQTKFVKNSLELWGADINWRTVTSYDATKTLISAIKQQQQNPTREGVSQVLSSPDFATEGVIGATVKFSKGERKNAVIQVVRVAYSGAESRTRFKYDFHSEGKPEPCQRDR